MTKLARAIELAAQVHRDQTDKGGQPYILHPLAVMQKVAEAIDTSRFGTPALREDAMIAAVLHDAIEDFIGDTGDREMFKHLIQREFGGEVYSALRALTHRKDGRGWESGDGYTAEIPQTYEEYIGNVSRNAIARIVKIADLTHNMDTGRLPEGEIGEKDYQRWDKYRRALVRLRRED